jgi:hypothetical protein
VKLLAAVAALSLLAGPCLAAPDDHDIAVQFLKLQERMSEARASFVARQVMSRQSAETDWARTPSAADCARYSERSVRGGLGFSTARGAAADEAARLIDRVVQRLIKASDLQLSALCPAVIGDSDDYNAVSFAGGSGDPARDVREEAADRTAAYKGVMIDRGLILAAVSDDELAAVVGHELGHLVLQHLPARRELSLMGDGAALARGLDAPAAEIAKRQLGAWGSGYLIETEMEADRFGAETMARAGYDPRAFASVLAHAEPAALRLDSRGPAAVESDFARRNAAAAGFAADFPIARDAGSTPLVLKRLKTLLAR